MAKATLGGYPKHIDGRLAITDWNGKVLGYGRVVSRSKVAPHAPGGWISSERVSYQFEIDGKKYHGRGRGDGIAVALRPMAAKRTYSSRKRSYKGR